MLPLPRWRASQAQTRESIAQLPASAGGCQGHTGGSGGTEAPSRAGTATKTKANLTQFQESPASTAATWEGLEHEHKVKAQVFMLLPLKVPKTDPTKVQTIPREESSMLKSST